jgi:hypothetical protein
MAKFKAGDYVILLPMPENDIFEHEAAEVIEHEGDGMYMVEVDPMYRQDEYDDGLREVSEEFMQHMEA